MRGCTYLEWKENHHQNTAARRGPRIPLEEAGAIAVSQMTATLARPGDKKQQKDKYNFWMFGFFDVILFSELV